MSSNQHPSSQKLWHLTLGALGIVYGDIGTSPLYALKESFNPEHGLVLNDANILGILSLVFWSLTLVIALKYLFFILRADNHGEGGITALLALLIPKLSSRREPATKAVIIFLGLVGAGLLYGDGIITPAISVLSAIEGLEIATPAFQPIVVPMTIAILIALFAVQRGGTARVGAVFGPITLIWFFSLAATGLPWIFKRPEILQAVHPLYAVEFFSRNGMPGFLVLSSVVLCITGGEALYADMGHFGKRPIQIGWFSVVFPALLINYFGQGALVLERGQAALGNTFYGLVSGWLLYPLVLIATLATVIASQALISGAFSLTQQIVQIGYFPRTTILHTSRETEGQIYVPRVNSLLMIACIALVLGFQKSTNLAAAYGIAVTATMSITSILFYFVARKLWNWGRLKTGAILLIFLFIDLSFFASNLTKVAHGGWIPISIAGGLLVIMMTWKQGRKTLATAMQSKAKPLDVFLEQLGKEKPIRVSGTGVFMTLSRDIAPAVLLHHYEHNKAFHEKVVLLSIVYEHIPEVPTLEKVRVTDLAMGFVKVVARYGYMESPDITEILGWCEGAGLTIDHDEITYYLGRETIVPTGTSRMFKWQKRLFGFLSRNAKTAAEFFNLPPDRVVEVGSVIGI